MSYFRPSKTKKRSLTRSKSRCDISTDSFSSTDSMASDFMGLKGGTDNSLDSVFNNGWSSSGNSSRLSEKLSVSLPKYIEGAIEVGKFINHAVIAVLTGNIAFLVEDIVIYAVAAKHCKAECKRLSKQFEIARDSAKELLNKLAENPKEIEDKSFGSALKAFAIVLEDGRAVVKQHAEAKYGLKVFHARKFAAEFQDIEERLDQACNRLNFAINIRHFVNSQELEETHKTWHEEDKKAFAEINTMVKETLEEVRGFKDSKNAPSLLGTRISSTELSNVEHFKTDRLFTATYHTINEYSRKLLDLKVVIKVTLARESVPTEVSKFALEVAYLQKLAPSPNIIDLIGITSRRGNMSLVLDYCENEDLQSFIASGNLKGDWGKKRSIALGIAQGMAFLHKAGILHKYINSANILLDKYYRAKITNFRKSRWSNGESYRSIDSFEEQIRWTAPERLGDDVAPFKEECDIYSFGIVFYEIVSERFPWQGYQLDRVYNLRRFERKELELPPNIPTTISSIFAKCTCLAPRRRFKTTEIIDHLEAIRPECLESTLFAQDEDTEDGPESVNDEKDDENKYLAVRSTRYLEIPSDISEEEESGPTREEIIEKANNYHQLRDYKRAREEYEKVADDYPHALFRLGEYYYYGKGVQKDIPKSIEYFEKAVGGGDGDAMDMIGFLYLTGNGLSKDRFKAVKYFKQAVDLNIPHGIYHLGVCHFKGIGGLKKDVEESKRLVLKAASMGNVEAKKYAHQQEWDKSNSR